MPFTGARAKSLTTAVAPTAAARKRRGRWTVDPSVELVTEVEAACSGRSTAATALPRPHAALSDDADLDMQPATDAAVPTPFTGLDSTSSPEPNFLQQLKVPEFVWFADMPFELRPYQQEALRESLRHWKQGINGQMLSLPTGTGKTIIFCSFIRYLAQERIRIYKQQQQQQQQHQSASSSSSSWKGRADLRSLILVHRDELLQQAVAKLQNVVWQDAEVTTVTAKVKNFTGQVGAEFGSRPAEQEMRLLTNVWLKVDVLVQVNFIALLSIIHLIKFHGQPAILCLPGLHVWKYSAADWTDPFGHTQRCKEQDDGPGWWVMQMSLTHSGSLPTAPWFLFHVAGRNGR